MNNDKTKQLEEKNTQLEGEVQSLMHSNEYKIDLAELWQAIWGGKYLI